MAQANERIPVMIQISLDDFDFISMKQMQLSALLTTIGGQGQERFQQMSNEIQDNLIFLAACLTKEIGETLRNGMKTAGGKANGTMAQ